MTLRKVALLSLEPWDDIWRRNQHLASRLVSSGAVQQLLFITPPVGGLAPLAERHVPVKGVQVLVPPLIVPRRLGGHGVIARWIRRQVGDADVVWVNDPVAGRAVVDLGIPLVYDITDDWRSMPQRAADKAAIVAGEDMLATRAATVVCSQTLAERWRERYRIDAIVVQNGVDLDAIRSAVPTELGAGQHAVYVGTLHENRLDLGLVEAVAHDGVTAVHLIGPNHLSGTAQARLRNAGVLLHGAVRSVDVPSWLVAADVLICPHLVNEFTLSLDAIKAHEYMATDEPIVATASCGFQNLSAPGLTVAGSAAFVAAVRAAAGSGPFERPAPPSWDDRTAAFAEVLAGSAA